MFVISCFLFLDVLCWLGFPIYLSYRFRGSAAIHPAPSSSETNHGSKHNSVFTLTDCLADQEAVNALEEFLTAEFSLENLHFILHVQTFKSKFGSISHHHFTNNQLKKLLEEANFIFNQYLSTNAPSQVNILGALLSKIRVRLSMLNNTLQNTPSSLPHSKSATASIISSNSFSPGDHQQQQPQQQVIISCLTLFDEPMKEVLALIRTDSFPRFLLSSYYQQYQSKRRSTMQQRVVPVSLGVVAESWLSRSWTGVCEDVSYHICIWSYGLNYQI